MTVSSSLWPTTATVIPPQLGRQKNDGRATRKRKTVPKSPPIPKPTQARARGFLAWRLRQWAPWLTPRLYDILSGPPSRAFLQVLYCLDYKTQELTDQERALLFIFSFVDHICTDTKELRAQVRRVNLILNALTPSVANLFADALNSMADVGYIASEYVGDNDFATICNWLETNSL